MFPHLISHSLPQVTAPSYLLISLHSRRRDARCPRRHYRWESEGTAGCRPPQAEATLGQPPPRMQPPQGLPARGHPTPRRGGSRLTGGGVRDDGFDVLDDGFGLGGGVRDAGFGGGVRSAAHWWQPRSGQSTPWRTMLRQVLWGHPAGHHLRTTASTTAGRLKCEDFMNCRGEALAYHAEASAI